MKSGYAGVQNTLKSTGTQPSNRIFVGDVSIAIAMISVKGAVVCSDGLVYDPPSNGNTPATRIDFDKTFHANDWIGACTGIMDLNGSSPKTIADIINDNPSPENLKIECRKLLNGPTQCSVNARHLEILLLRKSPHDPVCYRITLPVNAMHDSLEEGHHNSKYGARRHFLIGEEKACLAAKESIRLFGNFERSGKTSCSHMRKLSMDSIRAGIAGTGDHPSFSGYKACGGKIFSRSMEF